jgi:hypothetical protein
MLQYDNAPKPQNQFLFLILCCCIFKAKAATNDIASFTHKVSYLRYVIKRNITCRTMYDRVDHEFATIEVVLGYLVTIVG